MGELYKKIKNNILVRRLHELSWTKISLLVLGLIAVIAGVFFLAKSYLDRKSQDYTYEALVQVFDQKSTDPVEDRRSNLKKGDVLVVFPKGHDWSETERKSYLILKLKISPEEAANLMQPEEKEIETRGGDTNTAKEVVRMRAFRIKTESLKFNPDDIWQGQPYERKVFDGKIIEKKS